MIYLIIFQLNFYVGISRNLPPRFLCFRPRGRLAALAPNSLPLCLHMQGMHPTHPPFGQHMKPPPKTSNANLISKIPTCLEYEVSICYFGPHDSRHWRTPYTNKYLFIRVDCHLLIHKPQHNIIWRPFGLLEHLKG
jgi:hypothetical protein